MEKERLDAVGRNVRRLRVRRKLSQGAVAQRAGLSRMGYAKIENGDTEPRAESLMKIAEVLGVGLDELLRPVRPLTLVRFRADGRMTTREDILAQVSQWLDDYNSLEEMLGAQSRVAYGFGSIAGQLSRFPAGPERARQAADRVRRAAGIGDEIFRDPCGFLEDSGIKVFTPSVAAEGWFGMSVGPGDGGPAVVVNVWERISVERWIFSATHELGHLLLHLQSFRVENTEENPDEEREADMFASHLLMPEELFDREWSGTSGRNFVDRVFKVKRIFGVSWQTVLYRLASKTQGEPARIWRQFYAEHKRIHGASLRKVDEPRALGREEFMRGRPVARAAEEPSRLVEADFVGDRLHRLVRQAVEQGLISLSRAAEVLRLDLKNMRALAASWV